MMKKFISYDVVRNNAIKLGWQISQSGFLPDVIYVSLRGGVYLGNVLSEYFKVLKKVHGQRPLFYAAVVAYSYTDIHKQSSVRVDGWTYDPKYLRAGDRVLFVDDIFDTGRTINFLVNVLLEQGVPRQDIKVAVHDYKVFQDEDVLPIKPDFYCCKHLLENRSQDIWIHYLSHELDGLTSEEIRQHYFFQQDKDLEKAMLFLKNK